MCLFEVTVFKPQGVIVMRNAGFFIAFTSNFCCFYFANNCILIPHNTLANAGIILLTGA